MWSPFLRSPSLWGSKLLVLAWLSIWEEEDLLVSEEPEDPFVWRHPRPGWCVEPCHPAGQSGGSRESAPDQLHPGSTFLSPYQTSLIMGILEASWRKMWGFWAVTLRKPSAGGSRGQLPSEAETYPPMQAFHLQSCWVWQERQGYSDGFRCMWHFDLFFEF